MKLLSIKAHGFKSFADKIEIQVGEGITGIVGPNGSGKSNVVDAVKWVLGEASLKEIRGGEKTSDIIFAGSSSRASLNRAWVSLTFDNSDHYLASDLAEIEIKREIFKTGENEYYINNAKVRKKDITDLFLDSGSNANSFSIISQGKIMEILKGKPTDRRVIIEEASGTLKYKKRKEESMRKLENTNDNLEKVSLVIQELEGNVEPLRIQAEKAEKFLQTKEELKDIEVALLATDIKNLTYSLEEEKKKLKNLEQKMTSLDAHSSDEEKELEAFKQNRKELEEKINEMSEQIITFSQELSSLESKKQVIMERQKYEVDDQKLESNILLLKEQEMDMQKRLSLLFNDKTNAENEVMSSKEKLENFVKEYNTQMQLKNTMGTELNKKNNEETRLKNRIEVLKESIENDTKLPFAVKSVLNHPKLKGIHDVLCKLIETEEKYATSLEIALGGNANVIIVDDESSGKEAIEYLKENKLGRATFFPISVIKSRKVEEDTLKVCKETAGFVGVLSDLVSYNPLYKGIVENQLGATLVVDNMNTMNLLGRAIHYRYRIITLDGELLHTGGSMTGGINKASHGLFNIKFELENALREVDGITNECKLIEEHLNQIDHDIKILEEQIFNEKGMLASLEEKTKGLHLEELNLQKRLEDIQSELSGTQNVLANESDKELDEVLKKILEVGTNKDLLASELIKLKKTKEELQEKIDVLEKTIKSSNNEYVKSQSEINACGVTIGKLDVRIENLLNRLSEEYEMTYEKASSEYSLEMDEGIARTKVNQYRRDIRSLGDVNLGSIAEYERVNTRYTFLSEQKKDLENAVANLLEVIHDLDETMKEKFASTFEKVNQEFSAVFKKLFRGGNASLHMTDPSDLLTTGIDISAEPPGKSLKSIHSLSGGEMTLTAIALLFSILNIRIVPFCILDEVEAALDEANVDQFGTYIKEYEYNSQFIVITHKKRTMEYANTLYGITMQESGVSKLVSVRLENVE